MKSFTFLTVTASAFLCGGIQAATIYTQDFQGIAHETTNPDGWDGATRAFGPDTSIEGGANDRALIATGTGSYTTRKDLGVAVQPNTVYTLTFDVGFYSSAAPREADFIYGLGTWDGSTYTQFSAPSTFNLEQTTLSEFFFQSGNETAAPSYQFTTGSTVSGDNVMIRFRHSEIAAGFGGFDSITVTAVPEPSAALLGSFGLFALILRRRAA